VFACRVGGFLGAVDEHGDITWFVSPKLLMEGKLVPDGTPPAFLETVLRNPHARFLVVAFERHEEP
jgi:hypothetical protein